MNVADSIVIDCDSHVMEPPDLWEKYLEPKFRDRAIRIDKDPVDGLEVLMVDNQPLLKGMLAGLGGANQPRQELFVPGRLGYIDGCPPASYLPAARVKLLDEWGVERRRAVPDRRDSLGCRRPRARGGLRARLQQLDQRFRDSGAQPRDSDRAYRVAGRATRRWSSSSDVSSWASRESFSRRKMSAGDASRIPTSIRFGASARTPASPPACT